MIKFNWRGHRYEADDRFLQTWRVRIDDIGLEVIGGWSDDDRPMALRAVEITKENRGDFVLATRVNQ